MVQETIAQLVRDALQECGLEATAVVLEHPADLSHGDYSCNVALALAKAAGKNPHDLAEAIVAALPASDAVEKVAIAGPGFINFFLSKDFFTEHTTAAAAQQDEWGSNDVKSGERTIVEYTDPNPFKELHIGHLVPNALGESLARLHEVAGAEVRRVTFQGDVGLHVAKALWGLQHGGVTPDEAITADMLGKAYARGARAFEDDAAAADEMKALNKTIYERGDETVNALYDAGKAASLEYFEAAYRILGSDFDHYFFESETGPLGKSEVEKHIGDIFEQSDGAVIFPGEKYGLHTRVFINAEGLPTYESKDIGLALAKKAWWPFDVAITVTGTEQKSYFDVVTKAIELILPDVQGGIRLVTNGMLKLTEGKMSSRTGDVIPALSLVEDTTERVKARMAEADDATAQQVAVGAIKYAILKNTTGKDILFDPVHAIALEGDTGPYLQYTHARACSVLAKGGYDPAAPVSRDDLDVTDVERLLYRFPEVVARSVEEYEPHYVANYLNDLASAFNSWYAHEQIVDGSDAQGYKLAITHAVAVTLKRGLWMLGIEAPEKM